MGQCCADDRTIPSNCFQCNSRFFVPSIRFSRHDDITRKFTKRHSRRCPQSSRTVHMHGTSSLSAPQGSVAQKYFPTLHGFAVNRQDTCPVDLAPEDYLHLPLFPAETTMHSCLRHRAERVPHGYCQSQTVLLHRSVFLRLVSLAHSRTERSVAQKDFPRPASHGHCQRLTVPLRRSNFHEVSNTGTLLTVLAREPFSSFKGLVPMDHSTFVGGTDDAADFTQLNCQLYVLCFFMTEHFIAT